MIFQATYTPSLVSFTWQDFTKKGSIQPVQCINLCGLFYESIWQLHVLYPPLSAKTNG